MKNFSIFILLFPSIFLHSQFADNFEFLNHKDLVYFSSLPIAFNDDLYFVEHLRNLGGTKIYKLDQENNLQLVFETFLSSRAKLGFKTDTSFQILLDDLVEWDYSAFGFISVVINDNGNTQVQELHNYSQVSDDCNPFAEENYFGTVGFHNKYSWIYMAHDNETQNNYLIYETDSCEYATEMFDGNSKGRLQNDSSGNLYLISEGTNTTISVIDSNLNLLHLDTLDGRYRHISSNQLASFFLFDSASGSMISYNPDSGVVENEWNLSSNLWVTHVYSEGDKVFLTAIESDRSFVLNALENGEIDTLTTFSSDSFKEQYSGIFQGDEEEVLYLGLLEEYPVEHSFVRSIKTEENDESKYDRVDFGICALDAELTSWEFDFLYEFSGDTFEVYLLNYDVDVDVCNFSQDTLQHLDVWTPMGSLYIGNYSISQEILPQDSHSFSSSTFFNREIGVNISVFAFGANCKFISNKTNSVTSHFVATKEQNLESKDLVLYPNPTDGDLFYEGPFIVESIDIIDSNGSSISPRSVFDGRLDLSQLNSGVYYVLFSDKEGGKVIKKIVKY